MTPRFAKVSEIADRFRVSPDAVYLWIRQGKIPSDCVVRIAGTVRVDEEQFEWKPGDSPPVSHDLNPHLHLERQRHGQRHQPGKWRRQLYLRWRAPRHQPHR